MTAKIAAKGAYNRVRQDGRLYEITKNCPCDGCKHRPLCTSECVTFTKWTNRENRK